MGKFKPTILILFYLASFSTLANPSELLLEGDSLFYAKKYTSAFERYDSAHQSGYASPSMLLKMSFIKEGLGDYTSALFYLNCYYKLTADRSVLSKMQELANENQLSGYEVADRQFFLNALVRFELEIQLALLALILLVTVMIIRDKKKNELAIGLPVLQVILICALIVINNNWLLPKQAIIVDSTFLMTAASAASEPVTKVKNGHMVEVINTTDAWTKIRWDDKEVYIRNSKLKEL